ncbi:MAG: DUF4199 domain-containing protein [Balneolaceae bacterium]
MDEQLEPFENQSPVFKDYLPSAGIAGGIFGFITFVLGLVIGYVQIASEPTGSFFSPLMFGSAIVCLAAAFAGPLAVWHFAKEVTAYIKLGQGALIGFLAGTALILLSALMSELWLFIDPDFTEKMMRSAIANIEAMDMPNETKEMMIDSTADGLRDQNFLTTIFYGIPMYGILNLVTGLIGAAIFRKKEEETF